jgi:uncharacterized protein (TIGR02996 family)
MPEATAFYQAIRDNPGDDSARLVFADWLDENGDPGRAEFIRAQVRLDSVRHVIPPPEETRLAFHYGLSRAGGVWECPYDTFERRSLAFRCRNLIEAHEDEWLGTLRELPRRDWNWSRGFLDVVELSPESIAATAGELFSQHPIRRLILNGLEGSVESLAAIPADSCLTSLDLILDGIDLQALRELTGFRHLGGLTELNLLYNELRDSAVDFLCGEPFFQNMSLGLGANPFTATGRQRLRQHFGARVGFELKRHPERLFCFSDSLPASAIAARIDPASIGTSYVQTGLGNGQVQLFIEELNMTSTLTVFDHAGDFLHVETREYWGQEDFRRSADKMAWLNDLGYRPATIQVKRFPGVYDFPKGWSDVFESSDGEPGDYAAALTFMRQWLAKDAFRYGSFCGGWWLNRKSGQPIEL